MEKEAKVGKTEIVELLGARALLFVLYPFARSFSAKKPFLHALALVSPYKWRFTTSRKVRTHGARNRIFGKYAPARFPDFGVRNPNAGKRTTERRTERGKGLRELFSLKNAPTPTAQE